MFFILIKISDIDNDLRNILERFIVQLAQFNTRCVHLTEWVQLNDKEIQNNKLQLSILNGNNDQLKSILKVGINLQNDLISLHEHPKQIVLTVQGFERATENKNSEKSTTILNELQQHLKLSKNERF